MFFAATIYEFYCRHLFATNLYMGKGFSTSLSVRTSASFPLLNFHLRFLILWSIYAAIIAIIITLARFDYTRKYTSTTSSQTKR
jgi:hypothetical protein